MTNSRTKGRSGEQEVARILRDELGLEIHRNWQQQAAQGGCDLVGVPGWAIEIKRAKEARLNEWWDQTAQQAQVSKLRPILVYRLDRQPWMAMMSLYDLRPDLGDHHQVTLHLLSWCTLVREELHADHAGVISAA
jgi:plasmid stability protein